MEDCFNEPDAKGVEYVWVEVKQVGRSAGEVLTRELPALVGGLSFKKSMRWRPDAGGQAAAVVQVTLLLLLLLLFWWGGVSCKLVNCQLACLLCPLCQYRFKTRRLLNMNQQKLTKKNHAY